MTLRSISANAAWICIKARPAGVVVSIGELSARNPTPRSVKFVDQCDELACPAAQTI